MSCHSTSGGIVSTSLARAVTGLTEKEVQHLFHALKREAQGMATPSELDVTEWRSRQYDLLSRMKRMSDTRRDKLRDRLFRSRSESVPDGATFHAWATIEARARQEVTLREITTAVDLAPPGSQAHRYDLGEDGRPKRVWYASYGSNLHSDRFMNYIEGGSPEGSTRHYDGCTDPTPPKADIPIRFAGARPHFALTSRVWHGGIAFIDAQKGESAQGLGRAYDVSIEQFDQVVAQENGSSAKWATKVPLDEALTTGRSVIGNGSYETILHIGDYEGAPVLTFTAPFSTREALTRSGHILRTPVGQKTAVRMPVMTNKPSPAYLRMIGGGLNETFGMDEVQQADYLRGCPGGHRWTRQQMVRILRGEQPDPPREPFPEAPKKASGSGSKSSKAKGSGKGAKSDDPATVPVFSNAFQAKAAEAAARAGDGDVIANLRERGLFPAEEAGAIRQRILDKGKTKKGGVTIPIRSENPRAGGADPNSTIRTRRKGQSRDLPQVKSYPSIEEQHVGVRRWTQTLERHVNERNSIHQAVWNLQDGLEKQRAQKAPESHIAATQANLLKAESRLAEADRLVSQATQRLNKARAQEPARFYSPKTRTLAEWQQEDERLVTQHRLTETARDERKRELSRLRRDPKAPEAEITKAARYVERLGEEISGYERRLKETHTIITDLMSADTKTPKTPKK